VERHIYGDDRPVRYAANLFIPQMMVEIYAMEQNKGCFVGFAAVFPDGYFSDTGFDEKCL
jgi:hypothetical protein